VRKIIFITLLLLLRPLCGTAQSLKRLDADFRAWIGVLAGETMAGREAGSAADTLAATYLRDFLAAQKGIELLFGEGMQPFTAESREGQVHSFNVVGLIEGSDPALKNEIVLIGAHYDHMGPESNDSTGESEMLYGADDNASGTAMVMELARRLAKDRKKLKRSVMIAFFGAEEEGLLGSRHLSRNLPVEQDRIVCMVNFDMVGRLTTERGLEVIGLGSGAELMERVQSVPVPFAPLAEVKTIAPITGASDHLPFYRRGIPAFMLITGIHSDYHREGDTPDKINYSGMALIYRYARAILDGLAVEGWPVTFQKAT
jgi:Zn-dependent M28 family amino/carboxypeptidase